MFELDGKQYSEQDIRDYASENDITFSQALQFLKGEGLTMPEDYGDGLGIFEGIINSFKNQFSTMLVDAGIKTAQVATSTADKLDVFNLQKLAAEVAYMVDEDDWDFTVDRKMYTGVESPDLAGFIDPNTGKVVGFDYEAYKLKGHDARENDRYYELGKIYDKQGKDGPIKFVVKKGKAGNEWFQPEKVFDESTIRMEIAAQENLKKLKPIMDPNVTGFTDALQKGEYDDALVGGVDFLLNTVRSVGMAYFTRGISLFGEMIGNAQSVYNQEKTKRLYGEFNEENLRKLYANGEEEYFTPVAIGTFGALLERIGYKGITRSIAAKGATTGARALNVAYASGKEGLTEYLQGFTEDYNRSLGEGLSHAEAIDNLGEYAFSKEAADNLFAGLIGGGGMSASGRAAASAFRADQTSNEFINEKINNIVGLQELSFKEKDKNKIKDYEARIQGELQDLTSYLQNDADAVNFLTEEGINEITNLAETRQQLVKELVDLNKLAKRGVYSNQKLQDDADALKNQISTIDNQINEIKRDANMALLESDLKTSGLAVKDIEGLNQTVYETEQEFEDAVNEYRKRNGLKAGKYKGFGVNGLILGNEIFINKSVAADSNNFAVGTHELLHAVVRNTVQEKDGSGNLSLNGRKLVKSFLSNLSMSERRIVDQEVRDSYYEDNLTEEENFIKHGEEYLNVYAQFSKQNKFSKNSVQKAMGWFTNLFKKETEFKNLEITDGASFKQFIDAFVEDSRKGQYRSEFVQMARESVKANVDGKIVEKKSMSQSQVDGLAIKEDGTKMTKAEYDTEGVAKVYSELIEKGGLDGLILSELVEQGIDVSAVDANVNGQPLANFIEDVKGKILPDIFGFNPNLETTDQGKFGLSGHINKRLKYRIGDVAAKAKKTVSGRSLNATIDDSGRTVADFIEDSPDARLEAFEEEEITLRSEQEVDEDTSQLNSQYRRKLKNKDGSRLIDEDRVEGIRQSLRDILTKLETTIGAKDFLLKFENTVKKTMKNIVQKAIGSGLQYKQFVTNNIEAIIDFSTVQDLVAMERLVGKGKLKGGKKIFTVAVKRLTKQEDIQKAIDEGKLPPDAINKSEEGVTLYEKRMPTQEELDAFFFGTNMLEVLGYELGASTLGTRKDGLSRMIVTELAQDAVLETIQEPGVMENASVIAPDIAAEVQVQDFANKINRSPSLKFSKMKRKDYADAARIQIAFDTHGFDSEQALALLQDETISDTAKDYATRKYQNRSYENWNAVYKLPGLSKIYKKYRKKFPRDKASKIFERIVIDNITLAAKKGVNVLTAIPMEGFMPDALISMVNGALNIGFEVKATTARGISNSYNFVVGNIEALKTRKKVQDDSIVEDLYTQIEPILVRINEAFEKKYGTSLLDSETSITKEQWIWLKSTGLPAELSRVQQNVDSSWVSFGYTNKDIPSQYMNMGVAGLFHFGDKSNDVLGIGTKSFDGVKIPLSFRLTRNSSGKLRLRLTTELDARKFEQQPLNLYEDASGLFNNLKAAETRAKANMAEKLSKASDKARMTNENTPVRGISIFDFDETVGISENFVFATKDGKTIKIASNEWPFVGEQLAAEGYTFDFSDFNKVTKGKAGPLMQKLKNQIAKYGAENVFILTARAPESQKAIFDWLKTQGVNLPYKNITGLGNSTGEAKAMWILEKYEQGYNDIYFVDDAVPNVKAVQNVLDQLDVKGKSVQAIMKFSKSKKQTFDEMLRRTKGIDTDIDPARARRQGAKKGRREFFIAPGADDFKGLMLRLAGKGREGEQDVEFFERVFFKPLNRAYAKLNQIQYNIINSSNELFKQHPSVKNRLKKNDLDADFTNEQLIRIYNWVVSGYEIPGLSENEARNLAALVYRDQELRHYADGLRKSFSVEEGNYMTPSENWEGETIRTDIYNVVTKYHREKAMEEFNENAKELLDNKEQMAKLEAAMGTNYVEALKDMLYRIKTGKNRPVGNNSTVNKWLNWIQGSVGAIMFFNSRSAVLQTISMANFINHTDNNIFAAAKAFANLPQFAKDFAMIFNSAMLKVRRSGLQQDVNQADLADALARGGTAASVIAYLLKIGFAPTQIADSFAISMGGAAFYRNRVNTYLKDGFSQQEAEQRAFEDFQEATEEAQQSSRPDKISQQQASVLGRTILAFQNTPMQYNRIIKKAAMDIANKRGNIKTHLSRIMYYGTIQSLIFYSLQTGIFAMLFDDEEDEEKQITKDKKQKQKQDYLVNGMVDTWLRGSGLKGAVVSTLKNTINSFMKESERGYRADYGNTLVEALNISPPIGSKARKFYQALRGYKFNKEVIPEMSAFDINNPVYPMITSATEALTNIPLHRALTKIDNLSEAANSQNETWQRIAVALGWNQWSVDIDPYKDTKEVKEQLKKNKKKKKKVTPSKVNPKVDDYYYKPLELK